MKENALACEIPDTLLNKNINRFGFSPIHQHIRTRLISAGSQTGKNNHYTYWSYYIMTKIATNKHDT